MRANEIQPRKLVIFDIDDTLVHTQTKVHVVRDGQVTQSLNSHDFTHYKLQPGETFDFGDFRNAHDFFHNSKPIIPMMKQLKSDIATGNKVVMVTARADFDDKELFLDTFRKYGIDMSKVHVYRAGNLTGGSTEDRKKKIIGNLLSSDSFSKAIMYDDAVPNLDSFVSLKNEFPNTRFYAWHVSPEGNAREFNRTDENFADGKNPGRKEIDPDVYEDLSNSIIARTARQIVPTIRAKSTPEGYVYLSTQDGLSLMIGCNIAGGGIDINIGSQPMETTSSGPHKSAVTKIISAVYQAAVKRYGTPTEQGTLSIDHDAGHGVWQHIAQKLGLQYDANMVKENFADGRNPQDKGDSKRYGVPTHASVSTLRKVAHQGGRKGQLAHWMANMKAGRAKK